MKHFLGNERECTLFDRICDLAVAIAVLYFVAHTIAWLLRG